MKKGKTHKLNLHHSSLSKMGTPSGSGTVHKNSLSKMGKMSGGATRPDGYTKV